MVDLFYVEDDPNIAFVVKEYLEQKDFKVNIYTTLAQARQYLFCDEIMIDLNRRTVYCCMKEGALRDSFFQGSDREEISLSALEYQLLLYLMENKGRTVTREKILEQIWDINGNYVNDNTLTVTMKRLRDKLHQPASLKTVRSVGYRMEDTI